MSFWFWDFELDQERRQLLRSGELVPLEPKAYELLSLLLERRPRALSRTQIRGVVWPGTYVSESTLAVVVNAIRQALGDDARQPRFIRTVHGFGYAFCGEAREGGAGRPVASEVVRESSPYPGLSAFTEADAALFFGREGEVEALWDKIRRRTLLAVIGPSGVGKTSFLRAGVIPSRPSGWSVAYATPGANPVSAFARALVPGLAGDAGAMGELLQGAQELSLAGEADRVHAAVRGWRAKSGEALVVLDQFEELFALNAPELQSRFASFLGRLGEETGVRVLLCLRDDFLFRCGQRDGLRPVFEDLTPLYPPSADALRRALVEPAARRGVRFEAGLVEEMVEAVASERGGLPLLAFAVSRLWAERDRGRKLLTREACERMGGVAGALAHHAEATLSQLGEDQEGMVREIFRNLVTAQGTRAAADRVELLSVFAGKRDEAGAVLDALVGARLLTEFEAEETHAGQGSAAATHGGAPAATRDEGGHRRVEIVHESLLTHWARLARWRTQDANGAELRDQLRQAAHLWEERGRRDDLLWRGTSYLDYRAWRARYAGGLSALEGEFGKAMTDFAERQRRRRWVAVAAVMAALAVGLGIVSIFWVRSEAARRQAAAEALRAEAGKLLALGQAELEANPTAALAYATKSLELADTEEARRFALRVLQRGPTALVLPAITKDGYGDVAFSPDGEWLAGGEFPTGLLHRRDGGAVVGFGEGTAAYGWADYGFGSDGRLVVGNRWGEIRIWSVPEGREVRRLDVEQGDPSLFVRGEGFFTSTTVGGSDVVRWTRLAEGSPRLLGTTDAAGIKDVDPAGRWMAYVPGAAWSGRSLYLRSLADWAAPPRLVGTHAAEIMDVAFHPDGRHVAAGDTSGKIRIWAADGRSERPSRVLDCAGVIDLEYSPRGRWLAAAGAGEATAFAKLWDIEAPPSIEPLRLPIDSLTFNTWAFDPSERWLAKLSPLGIAFWPLGGTYPRSVGRHDWFVDDVVFTPDGSTLVSVSGGPDSSVRARSLSPGDAGSERVLLRTPLNAPRLAVDRSGQWLAVSVWPRASVFVVPLSGGPPRELRGFRAGVGVYAVAFSPDGRRVAASAGYGPAEEKVIRIWDLEDGGLRVLGPLPGAGEDVAGAVESLAFVDDNRLVSSGSSGVLLFDRREAGHRRLSPRPGRGMAADPRNETVLAILDEPEEIVRLGLDGREPRTIAPCGGCRSLAVDPTGTLVATSGDDGIVRIVSAWGGEPHLFFGQATPSLQMVAFSPDGRWVASTGERNHVRLWPVPDVTHTPFHRRRHEEVLATLRSWTNLRPVQDQQSPTGWKLEPGPFPGWERLPLW